MISSIIGIEERALGDGAGRAALERVRSRLMAVSNLYRILGGAETGALVDAQLHLRSVTVAVEASIGSHDRIGVEFRVAPCKLTASQAVVLGLITNEAMTNAYKHAFPGTRSGTITVSLSGDPSSLTLVVSDDGCGAPGAVQDGLGAVLIESLAADLGGDLSVHRDGGTSVRIRFPRRGT